MESFILGDHCFPCSIPISLTAYTAGICQQPGCHTCPGPACIPPVGVGVESVLVGGQPIQMPFDELPALDSDVIVVDSPTFIVFGEPTDEEIRFLNRRDCHFCDCWDTDEPAKGCHCECHE